MKVNDFSWRIAGSGGSGLLNAGLSLFGRTCQHAGLNVFSTADYPSRIKGGHIHLDVRIAGRPVTAHSRHISLLLALDNESLEKHTSAVVPTGGIIYDSDTVAEPGNGKLFPVPLKRLAKEAGNPITRNTVGIGATFALVGFDIERLFSVIDDVFGKKGSGVVESNKKAAQLGYDFLKEKSNEFPFRLEPREPHGTLFLTGNDALSLGAIAAGCSFYAAYPMTPASSILHTLAAAEREYGLVVKHTEDEIAAIAMAIGASFAGARAMTGTSGGGFSLMVEGLGLAAQTETPLVVVESMRPGPASGMATHSGQGDLRFVLHAAADEFPRIVIAPGDAEDCYSYTIMAFELAEHYQLPVILLTDKNLAIFHQTVPVFGRAKPAERGLLTEVSGGYRRYADSPSGVSPRTAPGVKGGGFVASSYEHDEEGNECEDGQNRVKMHEKRFRKLEAATKDIPAPVLHGPKDADITIISWGSSKGAVAEAMKLLEGDGIQANFLQVVVLSPFPAEQVEDVLKKAKETVIVEGNYTSQLNSLIREHCLRDVKHRLLRYDGRPFTPEDIYEDIKKILRPSREGYSAKTGDY